MAKIFDFKYQDISGVASGQTAIIKLPIGRSYHRVQIPYSGVTLAQMSELRVVANGDVIRRYSGADELDRINQFDGRLAAGGLLTLDFERYNLLTRQAIELTVLGTGLPAGSGEGMDPNKITSLQIEIDIDGAAAAPSIPHVTTFQSAPRQSGDILRTRRAVYNVGAAGEFVISDLSVYGGILNRLLMHDGGIIDKVTIERDSVKVFERSVSENERVQNDGIAGRVPQSNLYAVDFTELGYGGDYLNLMRAQDFRVILDTNASGQVPITVESIDRIRK